MGKQAPFPGVVGSYELLEKIHEGGMGTIYLARHRYLGHTCVVKAIKTQLEGMSELEARFLKEARAAKQLRHPNIAEVYDFFVAEDRPYIVMELIVGRSLKDVLRTDGPPPLRLTLDIAEQALRALGFLHDHHYVHRDVSPDNLMLIEEVSGQALVKLIDLGLVKSLEETQQLTQHGAFLGKLRYAAPEQFGAEGGRIVVDARSDLYSLGVVLYELLTRSLPIEGTDHASIISGHLYRPPRPFSDTDPQGRVPASVRLAVLKSLAKRPAERFQTAAEFAAELGRCQTNLAVGYQYEKTVVVVDPTLASSPTASETDASASPPVPATATQPHPEISESTGAVTLLARTGTLLAVTQHLSRSPAAWLAVVGVMVLIITLVVGYLNREPEGATARLLAASQVGTVTQGTPEPPRLVPVDASPWAKVVSVVRADGTPVDIGAQRFTPLTLELAPGTYRITLASGTRTQTAAVSVPGDHTAAVPALRLDFLGADADTFIDSALSRASRKPTPSPPAGGSSRP